MLLSDYLTQPYGSTLFERDIVQQVLSTLDTFSQENIARSGNGDDVRVFAERLE